MVRSRGTTKPGPAAETLHLLFPCSLKHSSTRHTRGLLHSLTSFSAHNYPSLKVSSTTSSLPAVLHLSSIKLYYIFVVYLSSVHSLDINSRRADVSVLLTKVSISSISVCVLLIFV